MLDVQQVVKVAKAATELLSDYFHLMDFGEYLVVGFQGMHALYVPAQ